MAEAVSYHNSAMSEVQGEQIHIEFCSQKLPHRTEVVEEPSHNYEHLKMWHNMATRINFKRRTLIIGFVASVVVIGVVLGTVGWYVTRRTDNNECEGSPCLNGGTCFDQVNGYTCTCLLGYSGISCQIDTNECASNPCLNGGTCQDEANGYTCTCQPGYFGVSCLNDVDECTRHLCLNGGTCVDQVNGYTCLCPTGYSGPFCHTDVDECDSNPCRNGGMCDDQVDEYKCLCLPGYSGQSCQNDIIECSSNPCRNGGTCVDQVNSFKCSCRPGYTGPTCLEDFRECASNPCRNGGTCIEHVNRYRCSCRSGYSGSTCQYGCSVGWAYNKNTNYCYIGILRDLNWWEAKTNCESFGARLASSRSYSEQATLKAMTTAHTYWIGGNDLNQEGNWVWINGNHIGPWLNWIRGEPNNLRNEDCMALRVISDYGWNDFPCGSRYKSFCSRLPRRIGRARRSNNN